MLYETIEEYTSEIQLTRDAIRRILLTGESHNIETGDAKRDTTEVKLTALRKHLQILVTERAILKESDDPVSPRRVRMVTIGAGW